MPDPQMVIPPPEPPDVLRDADAYLRTAHDTKAAALIDGLADEVRRLRSIENPKADPPTQDVTPLTVTDDQRMAAALAPFGWTCGPVFWDRYYRDPWVFNLANAVERLSRRTTT